MLDVATGPGAMARLAAERIGRTGRVMAADKPGDGGKIALQPIFDALYAGVA